MVILVLDLMYGDLVINQRWIWFISWDIMKLWWWPHIWEYYQTPLLLKNLFCVFRFLNLCLFVVYHFCMESIYDCCITSFLFNHEFGCTLEVVFLFKIQRRLFNLCRLVVFHWFNLRYRPNLFNLIFWFSSSRMSNSIFLSFVLICYHNISLFVSYLFVTRTF